MNRTKAAWLFSFALILSGSGQCQASDLEAANLSGLSSIQHISENGDEKLFTLMVNSSNELAKDWSPELAKELARVFNALLDTDPNYFVVELLDPVLKAQPAEFPPILDKALSAENRKLYKKLREMDDRENKYGNG